MAATPCRNCPSGTYSVTVSQAGFPDLCGDRTDRRRGHRTARGCCPQDRTGLHTSRSLRRRCCPLVETTTNDLGGVISLPDVEDMPVNGRDYIKLIYPRSRRRRFCRPDCRLPRLLRRFLHERRPRTLQQLPSRRHRHERRLPQRPPSTRRECLVLLLPFFRSTPWPKSTCFPTSNPNMDATPARSSILSQIRHQ